MNYGDLRGYMKVKREYTGSTAATYVARTFIDSMRYGVARVFWYGWDFHVLGTAMTTKTSSPAITAGGTAFLTIEDWISGARWYGCKVKAKVTTCTIKPSGGAKQTIRFTTKKTKKVKIPRGVTRIHFLNGTSTTVSKGQTVTITTQPVLFG